MNRAKIIENVIRQVPVSKYLDYKPYLEAVYQGLKQEMDSYSYMQFSEDVGLTKSNVMYLIIKGTRPLTRKTGKKIADGLGLKGIERRYWDDLIAYYDSDQAAEKETIFEHLVQQKTKSIAESDDLISQLEFFAEWYHVPIFELSFTQEFTDDPHALAGLLVPRIRADQAKKSLQLLQRLGLLALDPETKRLKPTKQSIETGHEVSSMALTRYHQKVLELAKQALMTVNLQDREIISSSMAVKPERMERIKKEIRACHKKILQIAEQDADQDRVYMLSIQFFPMTKRSGKPS